MMLNFRQNGGSTVGPGPGGVSTWASTPAVITGGGGGGSLRSRSIHHDLFTFGKEIRVIEA